MIEFLSVYPMLSLVIYLIYIKITGGAIDMEAAVIAALITGVVALIGIIVKLFRMNKSDTAQFELLKQENSFLKEKVEERHTLQKAEEYHNLETQDIKETRKDITETRKDVSRTEKLITQVSTATGGVSKDIQLLGKDFSNYKENIDRVGSNDRSLSDAVKTFENHIQELGQVYKEKDMLAQQVYELINTIREIQSDKTEKRLEMQALKQKDQKLIETIENLKKENILLESRIKVYDKKIIELQDQINIEKSAIEIDTEDEKDNDFDLEL